MLSIRQILAYLCLKYEGEWQKVRDAIGNKEIVEEDTAKNVLASLKDDFVTIIDSDYPDCLKHSFCPPFVVFYRGDFSLMNKKYRLGVIGSRKMTSYGQEVVQKLIKELSLTEEKRDMVVVSGMAKGIDSEAERVALSCSIPAISVLGNGLDICYPPTSSDLFPSPEHKDRLVVSEYPAGVKPVPEHFPKRNRLIAAIIDSLLVVEADIHSGSSITVKMALENGKDVIAVPSSILTDKQLPNSIIHDGAGVCLSADDIIMSLRKNY